MKNIILIIFLFVSIATIVAQEKQEFNPLYKDRIDILFQNMFEQNFDEISYYFADEIKYFNEKGKEKVKNILKNIAFQKHQLLKYQISDISKVEDKYRVYLITDNQENFNFVFDEKGIFFEINMYELTIQSYSNLIEPSIIPFLLRDDELITFDLTINCSDKKSKFLFDTGAAILVIDSTIAKNNNLKIISKQIITGAYGEKVYNIILIDSLTIGDIILKNVVGMVDNLKKFDVDGIIGNDVLKNYVTKIDYDNKKFIFYNQIAECKDLYTGKIVFDLVEGLPVTEISIKLKTGEFFTGKVIIDSGASPYFLISSKLTNDNNLLSKFNPKLLTGSKTLTTSYHTEFISAIDTLFFYNTFVDVPIIIPTSSTGALENSNYSLGILGNGIIKKYNWIIDYSSKIAYLQKNKFFNQEFNYPNTNFSIKSENQKLYFHIIQPNSDEEKAGIKSNFEIISVNKLKIDELSKIKQLFKIQNQKIKIKYIDNLNNIKYWNVKTSNKLI
jgi:hypothetical protein